MFALILATTLATAPAPAKPAMPCAQSSACTVQAEAQCPMAHAQVRAADPSKDRFQGRH
jgi:hypothetical protein